VRPASPLTRNPVRPDPEITPAASSESRRPAPVTLLETRRLIRQAAPGAAQKPPSKKPLRVVTIVQEEHRRKDAMNAAPFLPALKLYRTRRPSVDAPAPPEAPFQEPVHEESGRGKGRILPVPVPSLPTHRRPVSSEPLQGFDGPPPLPDFESSVVLSGRRRLGSPDPVAFGIPGPLVEERMRPALSDLADRWPELPESPESDLIDECRQLIREARRQVDLEREQRGMTWSG
jgi:hypothetical protein